jgi:hypothetical protein
MSMVYYAQKAFVKIVYAKLKMDSIKTLTKEFISKDDHRMLVLYAYR